MFRADVSSVSKLNRSRLFKMVFKLIFDIDVSRSVKLIFKTFQVELSRCPTRLFFFSSWFVNMCQAYVFPKSFKFMFQDCSSCFSRSFKLISKTVQIVFKDFSNDFIKNEKKIKNEWTNEKKWKNETCTFSSNFINVWLIFIKFHQIFINFH